LFFLGEEGRKEKGRRGRKEEENFPSVNAVTMQNKKASMKSSPLRLFQIPFSRQLLYELFKNSYYSTYPSTAIWIMLFLSYLLFQQTWYNMFHPL
ncbi:MAG: hypothetical protein IJJ64_15470, partial [Butyrivibrio sp.]|nr:hypothetical protein [Butyrivibrio sp.]